MSTEKMLETYGDRIINTLDIIYQLRSAISLILALNTVVFYLIILNFFNPIVSIFTALIYGHNMIILKTGIFARSEGIFVFFFNLGIYFLIKIFSGKKRKSNHLLGFAFSAAFCAQTKLNGIMLLFFFNLLYIIYFLKSYFCRLKINFKKNISLFILVNVFCFCIFTLIDPYLYTNTFDNVANYFSHRWATTIRQKESYTRVILPDYKQRIAAIYNNFTGNNAYGDLSFLTYDFPFGQVTPPRFLLVTFLIIGIFTTIIKIIKGKDIFSDHFVILLLFIMTNAVMGFYLMFNFNRYFIQLVSFFLFFEVTGIIDFYKFFVKLIKK